MVLLLYWCDFELLRGGSCWCRRCCWCWSCWSWGIDIVDIDILHYGFAIDLSCFHLGWLVTLVVHVSQRVVELEMRVSDGAGAEEDWDDN